jgi:hypothetical protein
MISVKMDSVWCKIAKMRERIKFGWKAQKQLNAADINLLGVEQSCSDKSFDIKLSNV